MLCRGGAADILWRAMGDSLPHSFRGLEKNRLEALIDGVFAVALTLLVLDIKLPDNIASASNAALWGRLLELERHFVIYVISFAVIGVYWINQHIQFHYVSRTNRKLIWINLLYLLLISFLPFATDLIGDHKDLVLPCEIYGLALLALSGVSHGHLEYLARHPALASSELTPAVVSVIRRRILVFTLVPLLSMGLAFTSTHLALYAYVLLLAAHVFPGRVDEQISTTSPAAVQPDDTLSA